MTEWPEYQSHKIVRAAQIIGFEVYPGGAGVRERAIVATLTGSPEPFEPTVPAMLEKAEVGDWAMLYPDGFKSISPAKAFEDGYTLVTP